MLVLSVFIDICFISRQVHPFIILSPIIVIIITIIIIIIVIINTII